MMRRRIAYAGVPGAFSEMACLDFRPDYEPVGYPGFAEALGAVLAGEAGCAAIPVENDAAGPVPGVAALIDRADLKVVSEHELAVAMHCLALPGAAFHAIAQVRSHPVALTQCARFLQDKDWDRFAASNTAAAAAALKDCGDEHCAVLASQRAAQLYGLAILARDVQDLADNRTRFVIVERA